VPFRRRRPLLRAAAVGGGAYALGSHNARRREEEANQNAQIEQLQSQPPAPAAAVAPAPAPAAAESGGISQAALDRLGQLGKLHDEGVLTDQEFSDAKQKVLAG
jgi:hypothetical protein